MFGSFGAGAQVVTQFVACAGRFGAELSKHSFSVGAGALGLGALAELTVQRGDGTEEVTIPADS